MLATLDGISLLWLLLLGHLIGDFFLQPDHWAQSKQQHKIRSRYFYLHALLHGGIVALILATTATLNLSLALVTGLLFSLIHGAIDYLKLLLGKTLIWFLLDQALHLLSLVALWLFLLPGAGPQIQTLLSTLNWPNGWALCLGYLLMLKPSAVVVSQLLSQWTLAIEQQTSKENRDSLPQAGQYIGYLERLLVLTFVLNDEFKAVGFILAAKSIFRMGDLREAHDRKFTEYVILGSLFSMSLALFTGLLLQALVYG